MIEIDEAADRYSTTCARHVDRPGAEIIAVFFHDREQWLPSDVEGPRDLKRYYRNLVRFAVGTTVTVEHRNEKVMSDVWDDVTYVTLYENFEFKTICLGCRVDSQEAFRAVVDAPPVLIELFEAQQAAKQKELDETRRVAAEQRRIDEEHRLAMTPAKGKTVKVVRGRKVPVGTVGSCFWLGQSTYGERLGLKTSAGETVWVAANNCEVVL